MHPNTRLTPHSRERMLKRREQGVPVKTLVAEHGISRTTFYRWRRRYRLEGPSGLRNRSSRPRRVRYRLTPEQEERVVLLRQATRLGPARLAPQTGLPQITVYRCLRRRGLSRLPRPPRPPVVRYECSAPGELVHLDVLYLFALRGQRQAYQFTLVDDCTRLAYACISPRRTTDAALAALREAQQTFGFPIRRVLTDNDLTFAWTPRRGWRLPRAPHRFTSALHELGIRHGRTRLGRPQTNGKVERFHRTIQEELYRAHPLFESEEQRRDALSAYLHYYNTQRHHTALGGLTPSQRKEAFFTPNV